MSSPYDHDDALRAILAACPEGASISVAYPDGRAVTYWSDRACNAFTDAHKSLSASPDHGCVQRAAWLHDIQGFAYSHPTMSVLEVVNQAHLRVERMGRELVEAVQSDDRALAAVTEIVNRSRQNSMRSEDIA